MIFYKKTILLIFLVLFFRNSLIGGENVEQENSVISLYIASFNRAPDSDGLKYWLDEMVNQSWSMEMVAKSMFEQVETKELYPSGNSIDLFIESVYQNVLNRTIDDGGRAYWKNDLETFKVLKEHFIIAIINGANEKYGSDDYRVLANKVEVGRYFALIKNANDINLAKEVMKIVTFEDSSVVLAKKMIDEALDNNDLICNNTKILDESFIDNPPSINTPWSSSGDSVKDIENAFNNARKNDLTVDKLFVMPTQDIWNLMSYQQKGLYILNKERYDRGLKPFEGIDINLENVSQMYVNTLYQLGAISHYEDGTPLERIEKIDILKANKEEIYAENIFFQADINYIANPIVKAIYNWIYNDLDNGWENRANCFVQLNDNSGEDGYEGVIGFGMMKVENFLKFNNLKTTIIVLNILDVSNLKYTNIIKNTLCGNTTTTLSSDYGIISYMAEELTGSLTANGELYDINSLSAAHMTLPFGTMVKVTNLDNFKSVIVRINDRGPYVLNRIIDITKQAAQNIELLESGLANGKIEILAY